MIRCLQLETVVSYSNSQCRISSHNANLPNEWFQRFVCCKCVRRGQIQHVPQFHLHVADPRWLDLMSRLGRQVLVHGQDQLQDRAMQVPLQYRNAPRNIQLMRRQGRRHDFVLVVDAFNGNECIASCMLNAVIAAIAATIWCDRRRHLIKKLEIVWRNSTDLGLYRGYFAYLQFFCFILFFYLPFTICQ